MTPTDAITSFRHFSLERDARDIAWLCFDMANSTANRLSSDAMEELDRMLDTLAARPPAGLVLYSGKASGFIAGADIDEFAGLESGEKSLALVARGWKLFNRIAALGWPTLALIDGHCLGGGLELALACRYRLAVDRDTTRLALPEVQLGIFPGWGGMQRLPRLIGPPAALDLMLTGKSVDAHRAAALGLVDAVVPPRLARQAAAQHVVSGRPARRARGLPQWLNHPSLKPLVAWRVRKTLEQRDPHRHYAAPRAILDIWLEHDGNPLKAPQQIESLTRSPATANLLRLFHLRERLRQIGRDSGQANIRSVHVVGAGTMGADIAAWLALHGLRVSLQDRDPAAIARAIAQGAALFRRRLKTPRRIQDALDRMIPDPEGHGVATADLVLEAIVEDAQAKQALYQSLEPRMRADAILATNTSSLPITDLAQGLARPERLLGLHFFNPVRRMPLVEVVHTDTVDKTTLARATAFVHQIDKLALPVRDHPGFLVNAVLAPYVLEAMRAVDQGYTPATIDHAMEAFGMPMGPLELADTVGLDVIRAAGEQLGPDDALPICLMRHLDAHQLGAKTSQGFYLWANGKPQKGPAATPPTGLAQRLIDPLIAQTLACVQQGIVRDADLADAGVVFGTGFAPFLGGPLHYASAGLDANKP